MPLHSLETNEHQFASIIYLPEKSETRSAVQLRERGASDLHSSKDTLHSSEIVLVKALGN